MGKASTKKANRAIHLTKAEQDQALIDLTDDETRAALVRRRERLNENIKKAQEQIADIATNRFFDHLVKPSKEDKANDERNIEAIKRGIALMKQSLAEIDRREKASGKLLRSLSHREPAEAAAE